MAANSPWYHSLPHPRLPKLSPIRKREASIGVLFLLPWILGLLLLKLLPILLALGLSLTDFFMLDPQHVHFIGLANYLTFFRDQDAQTALTKNLSLALYILPVQLLAATGLALALDNKHLVSKLWFRTLFFLPSVIPGAAAMYVWNGVLGQKSGWLYLLLLRPLGLGRLLPALNSAGINTLQIFLSLWSIGPGFIILLGALQGIDPELLEAAKVDGAGSLARLFRIILPIISPALFFSLVINLVNVLGGAPLFDRGDANSGGSSVFDTYIHTVLFRTDRLGYASSLAWILLVVTALIIGAVFWSSRYWVFYPGEEEA